MKLAAIEAELAVLREERRAERTPRTGPRMRRAIGVPKPRLVLFCVAVVIPATTYAAIIGVPNTFTNGTIADANKVNANFDTLVTESNAQHARLEVLEASVASNTYSRRLSRALA